MKKSYESIPDILHNANTRGLKKCINYKIARSKQLGPE